jgi:hypothetical protein
VSNVPEICLSRNCVLRTLSTFVTAVHLVRSALGGIEPRELNAERFGRKCEDCPAASPKARPLGDEIERARHSLAVVHCVPELHVCGVRFPFWRVVIAEFAISRRKSVLSTLLFRWCESWDEWQVLSISMGTVPSRIGHSILPVRCTQRRSSPNKKVLQTNPGCVYDKGHSLSATSKSNLEFSVIYDISFGCATLILDHSIRLWIRRV